MSDTVIRMPKLADTLVEGTVGRWLKQVGDEVRVGEPLASIETDKVTTDLTSPAAGTVAELLVAEGATVPVETPLLRIAAQADAGSAPANAASRPAGVAGARQPPPAALQARDEPSQGASRGTSQSATEASRGTSQSAPAASRVSQPELQASHEAPGTSRGAPKPTPVAARMLAEHGLRPADIRGGVGRVTKREVLRYLDGLQANKPPRALLLQSQPVPLSRMRAAIADHMTRAKRSIPHGQTVMRADLTKLVAWREQHKDAFQHENDGAGLTYTVLFVAALARALVQRQIARSGEAHIGVAVAVEGGLIVPVIRAADTLDLPQTARAIAVTARLARRSELRPEHTQNAVMTLSNVGSFGNVFASPIIPLNQLGILGPGVVESRPLATNQGEIRRGYACLFTLMFDRSRMTDLDADRLLRLTLELLLELPKDAHR